MMLDLTTEGFSLANAKICAAASAAAYDAKNAKIVSPFDGTAVTFTEYLLDDGSNCILIAFEGSKNLRQFITDAKAWKRNVDGTAIHAGFLSTILSLMPGIREMLNHDLTMRLVLTGHSLGGALAQCAAYCLDSNGFKVHSVYTFGGPRVGVASGVRLYGKLAERTYRVTNGADIVPWTPGIVAGYRHTETEYWMRGPALVKNPPMWVKLLLSGLELYREWRRGSVALLTDHFIASYQKALEAIL